MPPRTAIVACLACRALLAQPAKMVTLDLAAVSNRGEFIGNLHPEDFQVFDAGRRQQITYFLPGQKGATPQTTLRQRGYSNHAYPTFPEALAVVLDQLTTNLEFRNDEWDQILRALRREPSDHHLYLYLLTKTGALLPVHGMPDSWVDDAPSTDPWTRNLPSLFDDMRSLYRPKPAPGGKEGRDRADAPGWALGELAARLAAVPGPKAIVWIGPAAPGKPAFESGAIPRSTDGAVPDPIPVYRVGQRGSLMHSGDIRQAITRAIDDRGRWYRIGYLPSAANWDGRQHELRIACTRPGVQIHARRSYLAVKPVDLADDRRESIPDLVPLCPFDAAAIGLTASPVSRSSSTAHLAVRIDSPGVPGPFAIQPVIYTSDGHVEALQEAARMAGPETTLDVRLTQAAARIRLVVWDRTSRSFGTVTVPVKEGGN